MGNAYLNIAEQVLLDARRPLTPKEILNDAYLRKLVPSHLHGKTQHKTLHARLSEDIAEHFEQSRFFRTAAGRFFLRSLRNDASTPSAYRKEHFAPPRRKELRRQAILAIYAHAVPARSRSERISVDRLIDALRRGNYSYVHWSDLGKVTEVIPVQSFVVVHRDGNVLSFRCGKFTPKSDPIHGMRSIGFGGSVMVDDVDLVYDSFFGIIENGIDELVYGIGLPRRLAEEARYQQHIRVHFGTVVYSIKNKLNYFQVILSYRCPDEFLPSKVALSLNELRWLDSRNPANNLGDFDETSRLLIEQGFLAEIISGS